MDNKSNQDEPIESRVPFPLVALVMFSMACTAAIAHMLNDDMMWIVSVAACIALPTAYALSSYARERRAKQDASLTATDTSVDNQH